MSTNSFFSWLNQNGVNCCDVFVNNQSYKKGELLVLNVNDYDNITTGVIQTILVQNNKVYFVLKAYECVRMPLQYFESQKQYSSCVFKESNKLADCKPLTKRGTVKKFIFVLHHNISFILK